MPHVFLRLRILVCLLVLLAFVVPAAFLGHAAATPAAVIAGRPAPGSVQSFLDRQPGVLSSYRDGAYTAAQIIEGYAAYYSLNPHILVTLLEVGPGLITNPKPAQTTLERPFGSRAPQGFGAQVDWATREIRAGFGPYSQDPVVTFTDGTTTIISRQQEPALVAVQRFLAAGRTRSEWQTLVDRYQPQFRAYFGDEPQAPTPTAALPAVGGFLGLPWQPGTRMIHSSYFDHVYPTVDKGSDGNDFIINYLGQSNLSYNTHDGHDYYFPDRPTGTPIVAAADGDAYAFTTRGNGVVIRHPGGYETVYWHLDQFDIKFKDAIDRQIPVQVKAGDVLGTSGKSGFTDGGAHLHFEVRHNGKEVDPYGWYGGGPDPCAAWTEGCEASIWLWQDSLRGSYDFTEPTTAAPPVDKEPPVGTLSVLDRSDLSLLAHFDNHVVPSIGTGFPETTAANGDTLRYGPGVFGQAVTVGPGVNLTYPISGNVELSQGTMALWVKVPTSFPASSTRRHYLLAASENLNDSTQSLYTNTLALRHQQINAAPEWNFWTVDGQGVRQDLVVPDTLQPGWHHFAVTWNTTGGTKGLWIDGVQVAQAHGVTLPNALGKRLEIGRWSQGYGDSGTPLDELAIYRRPLVRAEVADLAAKHDLGARAMGAIDNAPVVTSRDVVLDTNAIDAQGGIVSVQLKRDDEPWGDPLPYYDSYRWSITGTVGLHHFSVRYSDRSNNVTEVTTAVTLASQPVGTVTLLASTATTATLGLTVTGDLQSTMMEVAATPDFADAAWEPLSTVKNWQWSLDPEARRVVYVRFRDGQGVVSDLTMVGSGVQQTFLPQVTR